MLWNVELRNTMDSCRIALCLSVFISYVDSQLIATPPQNVAAYNGSDVQLQCAFSDDTYRLLWAECISGPSCQILFEDGEPITGAIIDQAYSTANVSVPPRKQINFVISDIQLKHGGKFYCRVYAPTETSSAEVVVLDRPSCTSNLTSGNEVELGDYMHLTSNLTYQGKWEPNMDFKNPSGGNIGGKENESTGQRIQYSVNVQADRSHHGQSFTAVWLFDTITTGTDEAANTPDFPTPNDCTFGPITVYYAPEYITIEPVQPSYHVGETITCEAQGNPSPSYTWTDMNDTSADIGGDTLTVTEEMLTGDQRFRCSACNNYFNENRCLTEDISFTAFMITAAATTTSIRTTGVDLTTTTLNANATPQDISEQFTLTPGGIAGLTVAILILLAGNVVLFVLFWRERQGKQKREKNEIPTPVPPPMYENVAMGTASDRPAGNQNVPEGEDEPRCGPYESLDAMRQPHRPAAYESYRPGAVSDVTDASRDYYNLSA